jgi:phage-related protein
LWSRKAEVFGGAGVMEIALAYRGNAFRVAYAVQIGAELWVVQAFQKRTFPRIRNADIARFTLDRLMGVINRLGARVEVKLKLKPVPHTAHGGLA